MRKVLRSFLFISLLSLVVLSCEKESEPFPPVKSQEKPSISLPDGNNLITAALDIATQWLLQKYWRSEEMPQALQILTG
jgi:hypothetical protein